MFVSKNHAGITRRLCSFVPSFDVWCAVCCAALAFTSVCHAQGDTPAKVTYEDDVKPIFRQYCLSCHQQSDKKGGLALDTFSSVVEGGGSGEIVFNDGDVDGSRLWQLVNHDDTPVMPPKQDKLPADKLAVLRAWIEGGILENSGSKAAKRKPNALAFSASSGKPEGAVAMPETMPLSTPVVTSRASAITAIAASPWAPLIAVAGQQQIVVYHSDTAELLGILPFPEGIAQDLKFSRDGAYLIAGGGEHSVLGVVAIFDVKTGERVATVGDELDTVFGADVNEKVSRAAMGGPQKMLRIYDVASGEKLFDLKKHTDWIYTVAYSPDGVLIASGDRAGGLSVWEADTGRLYMDLVGHKDAVLAVAWRDDSNVLASASQDGTVKLWEMFNGTTVKSINAHGGGVTGVAFDHQGRLATAGRDNRVRLWDANGAELKVVGDGSEDMLEVAISHDGSRLIYGNWAGQVFDTPVDNPDAALSIAANPEPAEKRIEAVKTTLVSAQQQLAPLKTSLDEALAALAQSQQAVNLIDQQSKALLDKATEAETAAVKATEQVQRFEQELPALSLALRDLQDDLTARRVALKSDASNMVSVAEAEEKLAERLIEMAKQRRQQVATKDSIETYRQAAAAQKAEAEKLVAKRAEMQKQLDQSIAAADAAQKAHDEVASVLTKVQSKMDRLLAEIK